MEWKVKYVDLQKSYQDREGEIDNAIKRTMMNGAFILRDDVSFFEENVASFLGAKYAVGVNSGTDALYLACKVAGLSEGDEVITVGHTFVATVAAIHHCQATPILVDIADDYNIDVAKIKEHLTEKTKAIIPVHLNGRACNMDIIMSIAEEYNLIVIEDAAQAVGSMFNGKCSGTFGKFGCFSLHPMKSLNCAGDGGYIITDDEDSYQRLLGLRNHGQSPDKSDIVEFAYSSRLDNMQAAIANIRLGDLEKGNNIRREIAKRYHDGLQGLPLILPMAQGFKTTCCTTSSFCDCSTYCKKRYDVYNSYVVRSKDRDSLYQYLRDSGVEVFVHIYKPLSKYDALSLDHFSLPLNEMICKEILSLPIYPELEDEKIDYVISKIQEFYR
jgi:dTDP-4-amino-4,6-dideoxygalactose transaminase